MALLIFPLFILEIYGFFYSLDRWGFLDTMGIYFLPCLLGILVLKSVGDWTALTMQSALLQGKPPGPRLLHSLALLFSGLLLLVPLVSTRIVAVILLVPGLQHMCIWFMQKRLASWMQKGLARFQARGSAGGFGFTYDSRTSGSGPNGWSTGMGDTPVEREVHSANVLDVTPLKVTHEKKD